MCMFTYLIIVIPVSNLSLSQVTDEGSLVLPKYIWRTCLMSSEWKNLPHHPLLRHLFNFPCGLDMAHGSGWISNLYYLTDSDLGSDSVLPSGWVGLWIWHISRIWIWSWIQYYPQVGLDYGFEIFLGFGFGVGFSITLRLGWIMDLIYSSDLDSGMDSLILSNPNPNP